MKKLNFLTTLMSLFLFTACNKQIVENNPPGELNATASSQAVSSGFSFKVLQFNVWHGGTQVTGGFTAVVNEIAARKPDFVTISELETADFLQRLVTALAAKNLTYYSSASGTDNGVLSKYPIKAYTAFDRFHRLIAKINQQEIAVYSAHLDYRHYAEYYPRGYDPNTFAKLAAPVTNVKTMLAEDSASARPASMIAFLSVAQKDIDSGRIVVLGGDFNEASHLDWTDKTKDLYDHMGTVVPWHSSLKLYSAGYKDSYRVRNPDELNYPGFTWVAQKSWATDADERDRVDFIYYYANSRISVDSSYIVGPKKTIVKNVAVDETSKDIFSLPVGTWPTDHKAVMTVFKITTSAATLSIPSSSYTVGQTVPVSYANGTGNTKDWIGIYKAGQTPGSGTPSTKWGYVTGTNGTFNATGLAAGSYFAAYLLNDGYSENATRVTFTVH